MRRLIPLLLLCSTVAFGQVVVTGSGYATSPGPAVTTAQPFVPLVSTPTVDLRLQSINPVGASSQNGSLQVGATSFPVYLPPQSMAFSMPVYSNLDAAYGAVAAPTMTVVAPANQAQGGNSNEFDFGVGRTSQLIVHPGGGPSVAEIAARYRSQQVKPGHVYTNEDLRRLSGNVSTVPETAPAPTTTEPSADSAGPMRYSHGVVSNRPATAAPNTQPAPAPSPFQPRGTKSPGKSNDSQPH
jgi:hypothetical protein